MALGSQSAPFFGAAGAAGGGAQPGIGDRSLRFNSADSAYLDRTPASAGNRKTWTWAAWVKRSALDSGGILFTGRNGDPNPHTRIYLTGSGVFAIDGFNPSFGAETLDLFRDPSAWYHFVVAFDTTNPTSTDRIKLYVNGSRITSLNSPSYPAQDVEGYINYNGEHRIGSWSPSIPSYFNGYLADVYFIDGQALDPTSFGEFDATTGVWNPIVYDSDYGTNGFHLAFSDNSSVSALGRDTSGEGNNWTPNNFSVTAGSGNDSLVDVHYNGTETDTGVGGEVRGNYCTLNPLAKSANTTLSNGNLEQTTTSSGGSLLGTFGMSSGKWYWEATNGISGNNGGYGIALSNIALADYPGQQANAWSYIYDGNKYNNGTGTSYGSSFTAGDVIGVAFDADNGTLTFYKNGTSQGTAFTGLTSGPYLPLFGAAGSYSAANFGQRAFAYTAPSGFKALCTANLPTPTIEDGSAYMNIQLWTGNSTNGRAITGYGFSPDFVWIKRRNLPYGHNLFDTVRGIAAGGWAGLLESNTIAAENTGNTNTISSFDADGFTLGVDGGVNFNSSTYVGWAWDAGSSTVSNTDGSITSTIRASISSGFSIVTWTGTGSSATIGHGLGATPGFIVCKDRGSNNWVCQHTSLGSQYIPFNLAEKAYTDASIWPSAAGASTIAVGGGSNVNGLGRTYVAYCFAPVAGYSAMGSWTAANAPVFIYTGFRPAFLLAKSATGTTNYDWFIRDNKRDTYNTTTLGLFPNEPRQERDDVFDGIDFVSNGFVIRASSVGNFSNNGTMIYYAVAENPFKYARAR